MSEPSWQETSRGISLKNSFWHLDYDLLLGLFNLTSPRFPSFQLRWARSGAVYFRGRSRGSVGSDDCRQRNWSIQPAEDRHGPGLLLTVSCGDGRRPALEFRATLYERSPFLILEVALHNTLAEPIAVSALQPLEVDPEWGGRVSLGRPFTGFYSAGWQSWSPAAWRPATARALHPHLGPLTVPMHDAPSLFPARPGHFYADLVGVLTSAEGPALLAGLLSTADQFGRFQVRLGRGQTRLTFTCAADNLPLSPDEHLSSERVALLLADPPEGILETYAEALGKEMEALVGETPPQGWCSWTAFYQDLTEEEVLRQVDWLERHRDELPVEVIQVDDGWEQAVGDWRANERFPHGMARLAEEIRQSGFRPGLWLAPFIVHPRSQLAKAHPEWLLQDEHGRPVNAGYGWGDFCSGLDLSLPEVQDWLRRLISTVTEEWGYTYLKLDFLYAAALPARRRPDLTRAQVLRRGLEIIREVAGEETFLLGCGCPLGPAVGLVDAMRIGTDVAPNWRPRQGLITPLVRGDPTFPSTAGCLRNTLTRSWMHRRLWLNDPDALILRRADSRLTPAEVRSLVTVAALSGGCWMLGDDLPSLEDERQRWAALGLPPHRGKVRVPDLLQREVPEQVVLERSGPWGQGRLVALFNWDERPAERTLKVTSLGMPADRTCHGHEFWSGSYFRSQDGEVRFVLEPHGCAVFLLRPVEPAPQWLGSTLHLLQGEEVRNWASVSGGVELTLDAGRALSGSILLALPFPAIRVQSSPEGGVERLGVVAEGVWKLYLRTKGAEPLHLTIR